MAPKLKAALIGLVAAVGLFAAGYGTGRYFQPAKTVLKTETKTEQLISYRDRIVYRQTKERHVSERIVKKPDGTTEIVRDIDSHSTTAAVSSTETKATTKTATSTTKTTQGTSPSLTLSIGPQYAFRDFDGLKNPELSATATWRPLPVLPVYLEGTGTRLTNGKFDGTVGLKLMINIY